jgi:hypothetical protein
MVEVKLKGVAKVRAKGHTYYYAWREGAQTARNAWVSGIRRELSRSTSRMPLAGFQPLQSDTLPVQEQLAICGA